MRELGRVRFDEVDEIGVYEVEQADVDQRPDLYAGDLGSVELVLFDSQDYKWPVLLPKAAVPGLAAILARAYFAEARLG